MRKLMLEAVNESPMFSSSRASMKTQLSQLPVQDPPKPCTVSSNWQGSHVQTSPDPPLVPHVTAWRKNGAIQNIPKGALTYGRTKKEIKTYHITFLFGFMTTVAQAATHSVPIFLEMKTLSSGLVRNLPKLTKNTTSPALGSFCFSPLRRSWSSSESRSPRLLWEFCSFFGVNTNFLLLCQTFHLKPISMFWSNSGHFSDSTPWPSQKATETFTHCGRSRWLSKDSVKIANWGAGSVA